MKEYIFGVLKANDDLWYVALMEEIKNHFPPNNPLYAGRPLVNYHFAADILIGEFYRVFPFFSSLDLYFRFFPVLFSFLIGLGVYCFAQRRWGRNVGLWAIFFTCFCGSFGYVVSLLNKGFLFTGETTFWASQGNTILGNSPHALGIILLTAILFGLQLWQKKEAKKWLFLISFFGVAVIRMSKKRE